MADLSAASGMFTISGDQQYWNQGLTVVDGGEVKSKCIVTDLDTREEVGSISSDEWLTIPLYAERARFLHIKPEIHTR